MPKQPISDLHRNEAHEVDLVREYPVVWEDVKTQIGGKTYLIKASVVEQHKYNALNPNPDWEMLGQKWIEYALNHWKPGKIYGVAYIPSIYLEIKQANKVHNILPTRCEVGTNYNLGSTKNLFILKGRYQPPSWTLWRRA